MERIVLDGYFDLPRQLHTGLRMFQEMTGVFGPETLRTGQFLFLSISCNDCQSAVDCNYHDTCDTSSSTCDCDPYHLGPNCEIAPPCSLLIAELIGATHFDYTGELGPFQLVKVDQSLASFGEKVLSKDLLSFYGKPAYIHRTNTSSANFNESNANDMWVFFLL